MAALTFTFYATVTHVHDGDTIEAELDLGLDTYRRPVGVRLAGVDAAESNTAEGKQALAELEAIVQPGDVLQVQSVRWDKYQQRVDAGPVVTDYGQGIDVIEQGLAEGWLRPWDGTGPKPWPAEAKPRRPKK